MYQKCAMTYKQNMYDAKETIKIAEIFKTPCGRWPCEDEGQHLGMS